MARPDFSRRLPLQRRFAAGARWLCSAAFLSTAACTANGMMMPTDEQPIGAPVDDQPVAETPPEVVDGEYLALQGDNMGGKNLGGSNLGGSNLGGVNLGGVNLGGSNLGGSNLGGSNLGGSNLGGSNLGGSNLGGSNLGGSNLGGSNLGGSNLAGTNVGGNSVTGTTLNATALAGGTSGRNIHNLGSGSINGMLYSAEDMWTPKTGQCIVAGIGSTAFAKLLGQQSAGAKISVA